MSARERIETLKKRETLPTGLTPMEQREALDGWERALEANERMLPAETQRRLEHERDEARDLVRRLCPTSVHQGIIHGRANQPCPRCEAESRLRAWEQEAK